MRLRPAGLVLALALCGCAPSRTPAGTTPEELGAQANLIIVDVDTLRADHLGCYGYPRATSPNIDALAAESILFEWAFSQAPNTPPSQASIFTGLYPGTHGFFGEPDRLSPEVTTLAEALGGAGFATAAFVDNGFLRALFGFDQGFQLYDDVGGGIGALGPKALAWLAQRGAERFFLLVHTYDVHAPYAPVEPQRSRFLALLKEAPSPGFEATADQLQAVRRACWTAAAGCELPPRDVEYAKALYDAEIAFVDAWVGELMERLRATALLDRTIVVFLSDHGEEFKEHGSVLHEKLYTPVTRIPLLIRFPNGTWGGSRVDEFVESIDLMPTLLMSLGVPPALGMEGRFLPLTPASARRPAAISESPFFGRQRAVARGGYRLHLALENRKVELFHLPTDPFERTDLAAAQPDVAQELEALLGLWEARTKRRPGAAAPAEIDPETAAKLRALGYLN